MFGHAKELNQPLTTVIGPEAVFQGTLRSQGGIAVEGRIEGDVSAADVLIKSGGQVQGDVIAQTIVISGKVQGNVSASVLLRLESDAQVLGDVRAAKMSVAEGASLEGNCVMSSEKASASTSNHINIREAIAK
jgi:cytoskeletal protein CcmA (bactofilin family)